MRRIVVTLCLALAACGGGDARGPLWGERAADPLDLRAELSAPEVELLGEVEVTIDLFAAAGLDVAFDPAVPPDFVGTVERGEPRPWPAAEPTGRWTRYVLRLRPTAVGAVSIAPFEATAGEVEATTAGLELEVVGVLAESDGAEVEAPAVPFPTPPDPWPWLLGLGAVAVLAAVVWWWRRRPAAPHPAAVPLPPHAKALRELMRLRDAPRATPAEIDAFYVAVSGVLRRYLEERFGLHAPERTTEEFLPEVERSGKLGRDHQLRLRQFLAQCDLVKFAAAVPREEVHTRTFEFAVALVESTRLDAAAPVGGVA